MPSPPPTVAPPLELLTELTRRLPQRDDQRFDALTAAQSFGLFLVAGFLVGIMLSCAVSVPSALLGSAVEDLLGVPRVVVTATLIGLVWLASVAAPFLTLYYWSAFKLAPGDHHARDLLVQLLGRLLPHTTPGAEATLTLSPFDPSRPEAWSWTLTVPLRSNRASLRCVGRGDASSRSLKATWSGSHRTLFEQIWTSEGAGGASSGDTTDDPAVVMADALLRGLNLPSEATLLDADHALTLTDARPQVTGDPIAPFTLTATTPLDHAVEVAPPGEFRELVLEDADRILSTLGVRPVAAEQVEPLSALHVVDHRGEWIAAFCPGCELHLAPDVVRRPHRQLIVVLVERVAVCEVLRPVELHEKARYPARPQLDHAASQIREALEDSVEDELRQHQLGRPMRPNEVGGLIAVFAQSLEGGFPVVVDRLRQRDR